MYGTRDSTLQPQNGEVNTPYLYGVDYWANVARPWSLRGYGVELAASNKWSERNIMQIPSFGYHSLPLIDMPQYNQQTKRITSLNVVFPNKAVGQ